MMRACSDRMLLSMRSELKIMNTVYAHDIMAISASVIFYDTA